MYVPPTSMVWCVVLCMYHLPPWCGAWYHVRTTYLHGVVRSTTCVPPTSMVWCRSTCAIVVMHRAAMCLTAVKWEQRAVRRRGRSERSWDFREGSTAGATISRTCRLPTTVWACVRRSSGGDAVSVACVCMCVCHKRRGECLTREFPLPPLPPFPLPLPHTHAHTYTHIYTQNTCTLTHISPSSPSLGTGRFCQG